MPAQEFSKLISRVYGTAAEVVDRYDGLVDKSVGDEVVALFMPGFAGADHAGRAVDAARGFLRATGNDGDDPWIPVGAGVHTGVAAGAGEMFVSAAAADAAGLVTGELEARTLDLRGRDEAVGAWVARP
jgi:class 3 adenylate cyclase